MREDLLHYVWQFKKFPLNALLSTQKQPLEVFGVGTPNTLQGPDFFNARIKIDGQLWAGNVELHLKSSDWYAHHHETDSNYQNVILHVVWDHDVEVFGVDGAPLPTLELQRYIPKSLLREYQKLLNNRERKFINCGKQIGKQDALVLQNWLERMYLERLEEKAVEIFALFEASGHDWEKVLFYMLLRNFGLNKNGELFMELGKSLPFTVVRKLRQDPFLLEALLYGSLGLLDANECTDTYYIKLQQEYNYLCHKFGLDPPHLGKPHFYGLRPPNFPTIRLSQLSTLYAKEPHLFDRLVTMEKVEGLYATLQVSASTYWDDHYVFGKVSAKRSKKLPNTFLDLVIINTVVPLQFCYARSLGKPFGEALLQLMSQMEAEENTIVRGFTALGIAADHALRSQGMLQLYKKYCSQNRCLQCAVGHRLLNQIDYI